ncbi:hypothetical protein BH11MYX2_BH11MYX2_21660 [soil metagenome]
MSVVLRCPNCGTTQATIGDCDACHEAQVKYYCTNHDPGIWVAGPTCPQCDARAAARPPSRVEKPVRVDKPAVPSRVERPAVPSRVAKPAVVVRPSVDEDDVELRSVRPSFWEDVIRSSPLVRRAGPVADRPVQSPWFLRLVMRLAVIALVLVAALVGAIYWLGHSF